MKEREEEKKSQIENYGENREIERHKKRASDSRYSGRGV